MAAKKLTLPKTDIDAGLDIPDFNFDIPEPKDDRKPVTKIRDGIVSGARSAFEDTNFIRRLLRETLPPEFGELDDMRIETVSGIKKLYNSAVGEVRPSIHEMAKAVDRLVPAEKQNIKAGLSKIKDWSKDQKFDYSPSDQRRQREQNLAIEMGDIFGSGKSGTSEVEIDKESRDQAEQKVRDVLDLNRHRDQIKILGGINQSTQSIAQYNATINIRYQRRSLELQIRSYDLALDAYKSSREYGEKLDAGLKLIVKNTALPEYVKMRKSEAWKEQVRNRFITDMNAGLFGARSGFVRNFFDRMGREVKTRATQAASAFGQGAFGIDQLADAEETAKAFGATSQGKEELGGGIAGSLLSQGTMRKAGQWVGKRLQSNETLDKLTKDIGYKLRTGPQALNEYANVDYSDGFLKRTIKDILRMGIGSIRPDTRIMGDSLLNTDPNNTSGIRGLAQFTNQNSKSLNEIIPGYLARIYREIQVLRTGNTQIDLTTYDFTKNKFDDSTTSAKNALGAMVSTFGKDAFQDRLKNLFAEVDPTGKKLTPEERSKVGELLTSQNINNKLLDHEALTRRQTFSKIFPEGKSAAKVSGLFKDYFGGSYGDVDTSTGEYKAKRNKLMGIISSLGMDFNDPRAMIQELVNMGQYDLVRQLDLVDEKTGRVNMEKIVALYADSQKPNISPNVVSGDNYLKNQQASKTNVNNKYNFIHPPANDDSLRDSIKELIDITKTSDGELLSILKTIKTEDITGRVDQTNTILERIEKLISNNLKIVIRREVRESRNFMVPDGLKDGLKGAYSGMNYNLGNMRDGLAGAYGSARDKIDEGVGAAKERMSDVEEELRDMFDNMSMDEINEAKAGISGKARKKFEEFAKLFRRRKASAEDDNVNDTEIRTVYGSLKNVYNKTIGRVSKPTLKIAGSLLRSMKPGFKLGLATAKVGARAGINTTRTVVDRLVDIRDVYVEGEDEPRLLAKKLRKGLYFDKETGESIKRLHQIKGDIVDEDGEVVLYKSEIPNSYTRTSKGGIVGLATVLTKAGISVVNSMNKSILGGASLVLGLTKKVAVGVRNLFDQPIDIYTKDDSGVSEDPVLLAVVMRNGGYFSKTTGKVIDRPSLIDGPIVDKDGNIILTEAQLKKGLVNKDGKPIDGPYMKMFKLGVGIARSTFNMARNISSKLAGLMGGSIQFGGDLLTGFFDKFNTLLGGGKSYEVLVEIRNLLDSRLPEDKGKSIFDKDGDGDRDGSWQDMLQQQKEKDAEDKKEPNVAKTDPKAKVTRKNTIDRMVDTVKGFFGGGDDDEDDDEDDDAGSGRRKRRKKPKGMMGKAMAMGGRLKSAARVAIPLAAGAGTAYLAKKTADNIGEGNYGAALGAGAGAGLLGYGTAASIFGFGATNAAIAGTASAVGSGLATAGSVIGSALMGPPGWVALAVVAGVGAYKLYKYITSPNMKPLSRVRMGQYGFGTGEEDYIKKIQAFEKYLIPFVRYDTDGVATLNVGEKEADGINEFFGFDKDDRAMMERFAQWLQGRFKPVFLAHLTAIKSLGISKPLNEIDDAEPEEKLKFLAKTKLENGPYDNLISPFPEIEKLGVGRRLVEYLIKEAEKAITEEAKTSPNKKKMSIEGAAAGGVVGASLTAKDARDSLGIDDNTLADKDRQIKDYSRLAKINKFIQNTTTNLINSTAVGRAALTTVTMVGDKIGKFFGYRVDADEAVRFRTYGLVEMDSSKVVSLRNLEDLMKDKVVFNAAGEAVWTGIMNDLLADASYHFSIPDKTGPRAQVFVKWFTERFMPVYLNYRSWLKQATNQAEQGPAEKILKSQDRYDIASKVAACQVWDKTTSPWDGYKLGTDPRSTRDNLVFLRDAAKDSTIVETKKKEQASKDITSAVNAKPPTPSDNANKDLQKSKDAARDTLKQGNQQATDESNRDGEKPPQVSLSNADSATNPSNLKTADGAMTDGTGGDQYIVFDGKARLNGMNPAMLKLFKAMAQEYGEKTGKKIVVTSGYRTFEEQEALHKKDPAKAAAPGRSLHEFGLAVDIASATADELDKLGLMRKYGFTRPVGMEPWHVEMAGIQSDIARAKKDAAFATAGIEASPGKGGAGWGTVKGVGKYSRNPNMAKKIFDSGDSTTNIGQQEAAGKPIAQINADQSARAVDQVNGEKKAQGIEALLMNRNSMTKTSGPAGSPAQPGTSGVSTPPGDAVQGNMDSKVGDAEGFKKVALPGKGKGYDSVKDTIKDAAKLVGVDEKLLVTKAAMESSFNPNAKASGSATGLFQFTKKTWDYMMQKYGAKYGIPPGTQPTDARANAILAAQYAKDNESGLRKAKGGEINDTDRYLAHFLGPTGAEKILKAPPDAIAADIRPDAAAEEGNRNIFYHKDGRPKTVAEMRAGVDNRINSALSAHGIDQTQFAKSKDTVPENPNIMRASFTPPVTVTPTETVRVPTRVADIEKKQELVAAMKPPQVDKVVQSTPIVAAPTKTDSNGLVSTMSKYVNDSLETQKNQLTELQNIVKLLDHKKLGEVFAKALSEVVPKQEANQNTQQPSGGTNRNGLIQQNPPPISSKRMT